MDEVTLSGGHIVRRIDAGTKLSTGSTTPRCVELARVPNLTAGLQWVNDTYGDSVACAEIDPMHPLCADVAVMAGAADMHILTIEPTGYNPGTVYSAE